MARVLIAVMLLAATLVAGCSRQRDATQPVSAPEATATRTYTFDPSADPTETIRAIYGSRVMRMTVGAAGNFGTANVFLRSGEPTSTEPFAVLASLVDQFPGKLEYQVNYYTPAADAQRFRTRGYVWRSDRKTFQWSRGWYWIHEGSADILGRVSGFDARDLRAIASGEEAVPALSR